MENLIIGIVVMVLSVIGSSIIGIVETLNSSYFSGAIEYGLSDSDNQRRMRHSSIIIVTLLFVLSYVLLMTGSLVVVYVIDKLDNELTDIFIITSIVYYTGIGFCYPYIDKKLGRNKKIYIFIFIFILMLIYGLICAFLFSALYYLFYHISGEKMAVFILFGIDTILTIVACIGFIKKNSEKTVYLYRGLVFICCAISLLVGTGFNSFKVYLNDKDKLFSFSIFLDKEGFHVDILSQSTVSFIQEYIFIGIFSCVILSVIILVRVSKSYNKMTNLAFLYGEKNDKTSQGENNKSIIYIYTRIGNQFLYEDEDRLQYNKKEFDDELRKIKEKIKKKKWDKKVRREREKAIDRLKPYSVYIEIGEAKKQFKDLKDCIDKCADKEKKGIVKTILEIMPEIIILGLVTITITVIVILMAIVRIVEKVVLKRVVNILLVSILLLVIALVLIVTSIKEKRRIFKEQQKCLDKNSSDDIKKKIDKIIETFEEKKPTVKLLPEDELKEYTIYPIIDEERSGFFS